MVAIGPPSRLKCLRDAGHASPDRAAVHAASWNRDAGASRAGARARGPRLPHGRDGVRRRSARRRVRAAGPGDPAAPDSDRRRCGGSVEHARRHRLDPHGVPALLGLLPPVRSAQRRPHAGEAPHGHPRPDGHRSSPHLHRRRRPQSRADRRHATCLHLSGGTRLRAVPRAEQTARRHRGRHRGGSRSPRESTARDPSCARPARLGWTQLGAAEIPGCAAEYREVASDLARARTYGVDPRLLEYLERVVSAGHNALYGRHIGQRVPIVRLALRELPAAVVEARAFVLAGLLLFALPAVTGSLAIRERPAIAEEVLPDEMIARARAGAGRRADGGGYAEAPSMYLPVVASRIITNNVQVAFFAFAFGITAGIGTLLLLTLHGLFLGAVRSGGR